MSGFGPAVPVGGAFDQTREPIADGDGSLQYHRLFGDGLEVLGEAFAKFPGVGSAVASNEWPDACAVDDAESIQRANAGGAVA